MNVFHKFTRMSLRRNRSRTLVTIIGIMLSMAMFTAVIEAIYSGMQYLVRAETARTGAFHAYYYSMTEDEVTKLKNTEGIKDVALWQQVGWAEIQSGEEDKPYLLIESVGEGFTDMVAVNLIRGRMPQNENEIILPERLRSYGGAGWSVGDTISLSVGERLIDGEKTGEFTYFSGDSEEIVNTSEKTYTVVGIFARLDMLIENYDCAGYTALTFGGGSGEYRAFITLEHPSQFFNYMNENALNGRWKSHTDLLMYSGAIKNNNLTTLMYGLAAILVFLIAFGSISLIYNSFSISVSERTRQFGILKSVGATKKQIRGAVLYEAMALCSVAIPLGMIAGCLGIGVTLWFLRDFFNFLLDSGNSIKMYIVLTPLGLLAAAVICLITTLISAWIPARKAIKISPIDAIRQTGDVKLRRRDVRTGKLTQKLFGFEGMLALKNFGRNRKRYRSTVMSLFLSVTLFISASSFCAYLTDSVNGISDSRDMGYDIRYYCDSASPEQAQNIFDLLRREKGVTGGTYYFVNYSTSVLLDADVLSDSFLKDPGLYGAFTRGEELSQKAEKYELQSAIMFAEDGAFRELCKENGINADDYFNADAPRALVGGSVVATINNKWVKSDVIKKNGFPVSACIAGFKQIEGYDFGGEHRDEDGKVVSYFYTPKGYENSVDPLPILELSPEEAEVKTDITLGAEFLKYPEWQKEGSSYMCLVYPLSVMESLVGDNIASYRAELGFKAENHNETFDAMKEALNANGYPTAPLYDIAANYDSQRTLVNIVNVFSYGFIVLISLLAMANVFNAVSTSIALRRREFAMLRSVGLTDRSFVRMMNFESLIYGIKGLEWGLPAAFVITYIIFKVTDIAFTRSFYLPWYSVAIAVFSVFAVVYATMLYSTRKIKEDNPIDALKNENL